MKALAVQLYQASEASVSLSKSVSGTDSDVTDKAFQDQMREHVLYWGGAADLEEYGQADTNDSGQLNGEAKGKNVLEPICYLGSEKSSKG